MQPRKIAVLGSTGSIGRSTLDLVERFPGRFQVVALAAGKNVELLAEQALRFRPAVAAIGDAGRAGALERDLSSGTATAGLAASAYDGGPTRAVFGPEGLLECVEHPEVELVVAGIVGAAGLPPAHAAVERGLVVALANKEALVVAGELLTSRAAATGATLLPVDSEHNALHQCLRAGESREVSRLVLTASGGPFCGKRAADLEGATLEEALNHPTWRMGRKITVDSATLMNKGLEVIEAHFLFGLPAERIDVVVHRQSIIHSLVEYVDGSFICQMSPTDMRHPIQYALTWPERAASPLPGLSLTDLGPLTFEAPDRETFRCLDLGYRALRAGGTMPAALNAANEIAVAGFLDRKLAFLDIPRVIESVLDQHEPEPPGSLAAVLKADAWARETAQAAIDNGIMAGRRRSS